MIEAGFTVQSVASAVHDLAELHWHFFLSSLGVFTILAHLERPASLISTSFDLFLSGQMQPLLTVRSRIAGLRTKNSILFYENQ